MLAEPLPFDLASRPSVSLREVLAEAPQMVRVDRKYLVHRGTVAALLETLPQSYKVLTIAGRRSTTYRSTYFDTVDLATCRAHVQGRRRRWKARSRLYVEDELCRIEVKSKDGRGLTAKTVADSNPASYGRLGGPEAAFVSESLAARALTADVRDLVPTAEVGYRRATLADTTEDLCRVTLDWQVRCTLDEQTMWLDDEFVLVETKGDVRPCRADRLLLALGARQRTFSKYVATACLLRKDIPDNDVRRLHGRELHSASVAPTLEKVSA